LTQEALHGLRFLWHDPYLRVMASFSALANLALTGVDALIIVFLVRTLGLSAAAAGLVVASFGIGGVTGALVARPLGQRFGTARALLIADAGGLSFALLLPLAHAGPSLAFAVISNVLVACGVVAANIIGASFRQTYVPPDMLGRVSSVTMTVAYAMMPAGALLAGLLAITLGIRPALWILTALISASGLLYLPTPIRRLRDLPLNWPATGKSGSTIRYGAAVTAPANGKLRPSGGTQAPCQHHPGWVGHRGPGGRCHAPAAAGRLSAAEEAARSRYGSPVGSGSETAAEPGAGLGLRGSRAPAPPPRPR